MEFRCSIGLLGSGTAIQQAGSQGWSPEQARLGPNSGPATHSRRPSVMDFLRIFALRGFMFFRILHPIQLEGAPARVFLHYIASAIFQILFPQTPASNNIPEDKLVLSRVELSALHGFYDTSNMPEVSRIQSTDQ